MPKTSSYTNVVCPYCGCEHGDAIDWAAAVTDGDRMECDKCDRVFVYWAEHDVMFYARDIEGGEMLKTALQQREG